MLRTAFRADCLWHLFGFNLIWWVMIRLWDNSDSKFTETLAEPSSPRRVRRGWGANKDTANFTLQIPLSMLNDHDTFYKECVHCVNCPTIATTTPLQIPVGVRHLTIAGRMCVASAELILCRYFIPRSSAAAIMLFITLLSIFVLVHILSKMQLSVKSLRYIL